MDYESNDKLEGNVQLGSQYGQVGFSGGPSVGVAAAKEEVINSLEEPVTTTIMRDVRMIGYKLKYVMLPKMREENGKELRNCRGIHKYYLFLQGDLWGPLILCLALAMTLSFSSSNNAETIFAIIFVIIWVGAFVVTLNAQLLGGKMFYIIIFKILFSSFFQSVCVLGYCVFPINLAALLVAFAKPYLHFIVKLVLVGISFGWSTLSSIGFMSTLVSEERKILAVYPVFLFYLFLAWFSLIV